MQMPSFFFMILLSAQLFAQESRIAFGSCSNQKDSLQIFNTIISHQPSHFIFLGDNVYIDTQNKDTICLKYDSLATISSFQHLKASTTILSTWDDHDYGMNDAGKELVIKEMSKVVFLDFFEEAACSPRWKRPGIYGSRLVKENGLRIQFILLDTRTFRDSLTHYNGSPIPISELNYWPEYSPDTSSQIELLGNDQWVWLESQLMYPADIRIICSSIQFSHSYNGFESWNNFPKEKQRFIDLISCTKANGIIFISGDLHMGEISKNEVDAGYPLYDITSSGLSMKWHSPTPNTNRVASLVMENNFGLITIQKQQQEATIHFQLIDHTNTVRSEHQILLSELRFKLGDY